MDEKFISFKDFENVRLKATYKMEIGDRIIEPGETIAFFDRISIAGLDSVGSHVRAHGGFGDRSLVFWDNLKELNLQFSQGVFSREQFSLMSNSKLINIDQSEPILLTMRETLESNENGKITCKYLPVSNIYVYKKDTGAKIEFTQNGKELSIENNFEEVIVDYEFDYSSNIQCVKIGQNLFSGFVELEGRTRVKDDTTGQVVTGVIKIPRLKLMSDLSLRLGNNANPVVASFRGVALPIGSRGNSYITELNFLSDDIESDL